MPELPEVETTANGIRPHLLNNTIRQVIIRESRLRWPTPRGLSGKLQGQTVTNLSRRGKYLIFSFDTGHMLVHLGMSGSLRITDATLPPKKHDHIDWVLNTGKALRFCDPRRFGSVHWTIKNPQEHPLLRELGPEPLSADFDNALLFNKSRKRKIPVKQFIMDAHIVVGVGNIYANEALFLAGIRPRRAAGRISRQHAEKLTTAIKQVLAAAIKQGGTTLRDFVNEQGQPGYFRQQLNVYERQGQPCHVCHTVIKKVVIGQRSSYYCKQCQR